MRGFILRRDYSVMQRANNWEAPRWVQLFVLGATVGGDGWLWYAMGFAVFLFGGPERFAALAASGLASVLSILLFIWMKRFTGRRRPCDVTPHRWATLLPPDQFSFPSGHTMTAFAVAISLSLFYPSLMPMLLLCAFSIALSRILLGMHFLSDVMAGAIIGAGLGYAGFLAFQ
jgi:undecaprenyl-diphosphatase